MNQVRSADGTAIAFDRVGEGPPIVLVGGTHQLRSDPKLLWLAALLAPRHTVFNYDRRGGEGADATPGTVEREVEDLEAVITAAGGGVFGMSPGAVLALEAAARALKIEKLALYEPPFMVDYALPTERLASVAVPTLVIAGENGDPRLRRAAQALWSVLPDVQHHILEAQTHDVDPGALAPLLERFFAGSARRMWTASGLPLV